MQTGCVCLLHILSKKPKNEKKNFSKVKKTQENKLPHFTSRMRNAACRSPQKLLQNQRRRCAVEASVGEGEGEGSDNATSCQRVADNCGCFTFLHCRPALSNYRFMRSDILKRLCSPSLSLFLTHALIAYARLLWASGYAALSLVLTAFGISLSCPTVQSVTQSVVSFLFLFLFLFSVFRFCFCFCLAVSVSISVLSFVFVFIIVS